jgi:outer membrane receptor protein involved in Fe transport
MIKGPQTFTATSPRGVLAWHLNDNVNLYTSIAKGFRSGGFNLTSRFGVCSPYRRPTHRRLCGPTRLGGKFQSDNRRVVGDLAVYHNDWRNVQSLAFPNGFSFQYTVNGGHVSGWGVDAQLTLRPVDPLTLAAHGRVEQYGLRFHDSRPSS